MKPFIILFLLVLNLFVTAQSINTSLTYTYHLPTKTSNKTPLLIMLHGYGSNETDLFEMHKTFDERYAVFSLRAPISIPQSGFCWFPIEIKNDSTLVYDYKKVLESKKLILSFISNACKTFNLDSSNVVLFGFSQGAILSTDIAITTPNKIKGIIALSGMLLKETEAQIKNTKQWQNINQVKIRFAHGYSDNVINIKQAQKIEKLIAEKKLTNSKMKYYKMGHNICGEELNDIKSWLTTMVKSSSEKTSINKK